MTAHWQPAPNCLYETRGAATGSSRGTNVAAASAANTKGSWVNIGAATTISYEMLWVQMHGTLTADFTVDIGISDGSDRWVLAADLRVAGLLTRAGGCVVGLPLHVPAGSQISARSAASTSGSKSVSVLVTGGTTGFGGLPGYSRLVSMYTPATSRGTDVEPTSANSKTSWVEITSGIALPVEGLLIGLGPGNETARATDQAYLMDVAIGGSGSEQTVLSNLSFASSDDNDQPYPAMLGPFPLVIPASTRVAVRAQANDVTVGARKIDVALWGLVR